MAVVAKEQTVDCSRATSKEFRPPQQGNERVAEERRPEDRSTIDRHSAGMVGI